MLLLAEMLAYADKAFMALRPGERDGLEAGRGTTVTLGHPCLPVWVPGGESSKHN